MANLLTKIKDWGKETIRKFLVSLKRNPQYIPLAALTISFLVFSLNLTYISNTTAKINISGMGICAFVSMLFSILSFICLLNAFPKRQKPNLLMLIVLYVLQAGILFCDIYYVSLILQALTREKNPIKVTASTQYITSAEIVLIVHIILTLLVILCTALEPVFAKLLKKINTSVEVEDNGEIGDIELTEDE